jgi:DNA replication and repair protein RecF
LLALKLQEFRNYRHLVWKPGSRISAISGPNGSGKTNLLEAISLLTPGRGLRGGKPAEFARVAPDATGNWGVVGQFATDTGAIEIATGRPPDGPADRRIFRLDGAVPRNQAEIGSRIATVWLTPQMERLFQEAPSGRRRFLDRLVYALEPSHAREVAAHDHAMAQRNRLLAQGGAEAGWLAGLEDAITRHGVAATAGRLSLVGRLNHALAHGASGDFPAARIVLLCPIAERLAACSALDTEEWMRRVLHDGRTRDTPPLGANRADMLLTEAATGLAASAASTGQQKALLIGVVLGHAAVLAEQRGYAPLLLLDEPAVHLDPRLRAALFAALAALPAQSLLTGTDRETFFPLRGLAEGLAIDNGVLTADPGFASPPPLAAL